jgi:hypothetical protein
MSIRMGHSCNAMNEQIGDDDFPINIMERIT